MKTRNISSLALAIGLVFSAHAMAEGMSKKQYKAQEKTIEADYKAAKRGCASLAGNANDICVADAKGKQSVAQAELAFRDKPTISNRYNARVAKADAEFSVAKEKCDDKAGNDKDVCVKEADAAKVHAMTDAEAQMKTSKADVVANENSTDANTKAMETATDAHKGAAVEKREADYAVAKEKCESLAGNAKDLCMSEAKVHFGGK